MMKIAIAGTNGLAIRIAQYLRHSHHACLLLTRALHHPLAHAFTILSVNYNDEDHLIYTLSGIDMVISMVTGNEQLLLIDSALKAGVARFVPAEFSGLPNLYASYPALDNGRRLAHMRLRDHVAEGMEYTIIVCGLLYERFGPAGLQGVNMGNASQASTQGNLLIQDSSSTADIPLDSSGQPAMVCMTALEDVAHFVASAIEVPNWPRKFHVRGERMSVYDIVSTISSVYPGPQIQSNEQTPAILRLKLRNAQSTQSRGYIEHLSTMSAIADGHYDFTSDDMNDRMRIRPISFQSWLQQAWNAEF